jgi:Spy/CpxP family protein refolding chaperone
MKKLYVFFSIVLTSLFLFMRVLATPAGNQGAPQAGGQASMPQFQAGGQAGMPQFQAGGQAGMPQFQAGGQGGMTLWPAGSQGMPPWPADDQIMPPWPEDSDVMPPWPKDDQATLPPKAKDYNMQLLPAGNQGMPPLPAINQDKPRPKHSDTGKSKSNNLKKRLKVNADSQPVKNSEPINFTAELNLTQGQADKITSIEKQTKYDEKKLINNLKDSMEKIRLEISKDVPDEKAIEYLINKVGEDNKAIMRNQIHYIVQLKSILTKEQREIMENKIISGDNPK